MPEHEVVILNARQQVASSQEYIDRLMNLIRFQERALHA